MSGLMRNPWKLIKSPRIVVDITQVRMAEFYAVGPLCLKTCNLRYVLAYLLDEAAWLRAEVERPWVSYGLCTITLG